MGDDAPLADQIGDLAKRAEQWMLDEAFPFWAERGVNPEGGFFERLDLDGFGIPDEDSRVRVQARMAICFTIAAELGWETEHAQGLVRRALDVLIADCRRPDGLYGKMVRPGIGLTDDTAMAYDTAFALLSFAMAYRAFGWEFARDAGEHLSQAIDQHLMRSPEEGGAAETLPAPTNRKQNPHMHLTEASLAWFEATGETRSLERAFSIVRFVESRFYRNDLELLIEEYDIPDANNRTEAGHMLEWVWILGQMVKITGARPHPLAAALHSSANRILDGLDYIPLSQGLDGQPMQLRQRTWSVAEQLKAHIAFWRLGHDPAIAAQIVAIGKQLFADHIDAAVRGAWLDVIDPQRNALIKDITPATGYHVFQAFQELIRFSGEFSAAQTAS